MLLLPHSTHVHLSHVPACSAGARSTSFDMLPLTACALRATVMTGGQCCRHVGAATAACTAHVPDLRTALWTSVLGCGVLLWSLSNQTPCSTCPGPVPPFTAHSTMMHEGVGRGMKKQNWRVRKTITSCKVKCSRLKCLGCQRHREHQGGCPKAESALQKRCRASER